jgi:hypothetical protein
VRPAGQEETVAIDWANVGGGAVGEELAQLVAGSLSRGRFAPADARSVDEVVFDGYVAGLRDAGWRGDPGLARLGYTVASVIMFTARVVTLLQSAASDERRLAAEAARRGRTAEDVLHHCAATLEFLLSLADEAQAALPST